MTKEQTKTDYLLRARQRNSAYFIYVTDTFSNEDYPVFCEDAATAVARYDGLNGLNMQRVEGVYGVSEGAAVNIADLRKLAEPARTANPAKTYLGDGLYAAYDGFQVALSAEDGTQATDTVFLDPQVLAAFAKFLRANNLQ